MREGFQYDYVFDWSVQQRADEANKAPRKVLAPGEDAQAEGRM